MVRGMECLNCMCDITIRVTVVDQGVELQNDVKSNKRIHSGQVNLHLVYINYIHSKFLNITTPLTICVKSNYTLSPTEAVQGTILYVIMWLVDHLYLVYIYYIWYGIFYHHAWTEFLFVDSLHCTLRAKLYTKRSKISITEITLPPRRRPMKPPISPENGNWHMVLQHIYCPGIIEYYLHHSMQLYWTRCI